MEAVDDIRGFHVLTHRGVTLIELTFSLALLILASFGIIRLQQQMSKGLKLSEVRGEEADLKSYLLHRTDCNKTFTAAVRTGCTGKSLGSNQYADLRDADNAVFVGAGGTTQVGPAYRVRAKCTDESGFFGLHFEAKRVALGQGIKALVSDEADDWRNLSKGIPLACP